MGVQFVSVIETATNDLWQQCEAIQFWAVLNGARNGSGGVLANGNNCAVLDDLSRAGKITGNDGDGRK